MKYIPFILLLSHFMLSCSGQNKDSTTNGALMSALLNAENKQDAKAIENLFCDDALILLPDAPPIVGKSAIVALFQYTWDNPKNRSIAYGVDSTFSTKDTLVEFGSLINKDENNRLDTISFRTSFINIEGKYCISILSFGNTILEKQLPKLLKPTGKFNIGQSLHFFDKEQTVSNRMLSFQVWFPTNQKSGKKLPYRSERTAMEAARFLGWPIFGNSFVTLIESNSLKDAKVVSDKSFPVVIYNHGYGGFSGVYQSVFEELASHGYIVVSLGHQDESALLLVDDEKVIPNPRDNEFYASRASELNGTSINNYQSVILNSNSKTEVKKAYKSLLEKSPLHKQSVELWADDTKEVIQKLFKINEADSLLTGAMDLDNIGVFGHSVGGAVAGELAFNNKSIKAGINLDGFQFGNLINHQVQIPFMFVSSNSSGETYLRVYPFIEETEATIHHAVIRGFTHDSFSDLPLIMNNDKRSIEIQRALILSFFNAIFKESTFNKHLLKEQYNEVKFKN